MNFTLKSCLSIFRQQILCLKRNRNKVRSETASAGKNTTQHHVEQNRQDSCLQLRRRRACFAFSVSLTHREHRCIHYLHINTILTMWYLFRCHNRQNNGLEPVPGTSLPRFRREISLVEAAGFCPWSNLEPLDLYNVLRPTALGLTLLLSFFYLNIYLFDPGGNNDLFSLNR